MIFCFKFTNLGLIGGTINTVFCNNEVKRNIRYAFFFFNLETKSKIWYRIFSNLRIFYSRNKMGYRISIVGFSLCSNQNTILDFLSSNKIQSKSSSQPTNHPNNRMKRCKKSSSSKRSSDLVPSQPFLEADMVSPKTTRNSITDICNKEIIVKIRASNAGVVLRCFHANILEK